MAQINIYKQIRSFYSLVFNSEYDIRPTHISLYMFLLNQNNRANWTKWFKVPFDTSMAGARIGSRTTFYKVLHDLQDYKLIKYEKGQNLFKAPRIHIIPLSDNKLDTEIPRPEQDEFTIPINDTVTVQLTGHLTEQLSGQLTGQLTGHKDRPITYNLLPIKINIKESKNYQDLLNKIKDKEEFARIDIPADPKLKSKIPKIKTPLIRFSTPTIPFQEALDLYKYCIKLESANDEWEELSQEEREKALIHIPQVRKIFEDEGRLKFLWDFSKYLNERMFEVDINNFKTPKDGKRTNNNWSESIKSMGQSIIDEEQQELHHQGSESD